MFPDIHLKISYGDLSLGAHLVLDILRIQIPEFIYYIISFGSPFVLGMKLVFERNTDTNMLFTL